MPKKKPAGSYSLHGKNVPEPTLKISPPPVPKFAKGVKLPPLRGTGGAKEATRPRYITPITIEIVDEDLHLEHEITVAVEDSDIVEILEDTEEDTKSRWGSEETKAWATLTGKEAELIKVDAFLLYVDALPLLWDRDDTHVSSEIRAWVCRWNPRYRVIIRAGVLEDKREAISVLAKAERKSETYVYLDLLALSRTIP